LFDLFFYREKILFTPHKIKNCRRASLSEAGNRLIENFFNIIILKFV
jgi:hypothetical protein